MLHIISSTPVEMAIIERIGTTDVVIFIENAVLGVLQQGALVEQLLRKMGGNHFYVLTSDIESRGIGVDELIPGIEVLDYCDFVELTIQNSVIQSWC